MTQLASNGNIKLQSLPITLGHLNKFDVYPSCGPLPPFSMLGICFSASQNGGRGGGGNR